MPSVNFRNLVYRLAAPAAQSPGKYAPPSVSGHPLSDPDGLLRILRKHHVFGSSVLISDGTQFCRIDVSPVGFPEHAVRPDSIFRVASITKPAVVLTLLRLAEIGALKLDDSVADHLPDGEREESLRSISLRHLMCHRSGLRDTPFLAQALEQGLSWHDVLAKDGTVSARPGAVFSYCNFGYGLLGCVMEQVTGKPLSQVMRGELFDPLGMNAEMDASRLDPERIVAIRRVLSRHPQPPVKIPPLGHVPLDEADPIHHFGHTAGAMYTDAESLSKMMQLIRNEGIADGKRLLEPSSVREMTRTHATYGSSDPSMQYGLGLLYRTVSGLPGAQIAGHQGYAYGCVDGAFYDVRSGWQLISLNGGAVEARDGRLGLLNRDLLRWSMGKELPSWQ